MTQTYPQHPYPAPQQPPEPKKKRGALKWILIIVGIFVALLVAMGACTAVLLSNDDSAVPAGGASPTSEPQPEGSQPPAEKTFKIGEKATDDAYQFTVTKIKCGVSRVGDQYSGEKPQGQFCLVSMRIKNVGNDPITFTDENQTLIDTEGKNYSPDDEAWVYVQDGNVWDEINPGNTLKTVVPYDIPKKAEPDALLLKAGSFGFSEGVRVTLN